jgi:Tfp pilus assembly protein PilN
MKAVNLIPPDARKSGRGSAGPGFATGIGAYVLLGALAVAVLMAGAWAMTGRQLSDKQTDLARVQREAQTAEAKVASLAPYKQFSTLATSRVDTLTGLIDGRFDWSAGLREVARVIPADVDLTSLVGTTSPSSRVEGAGGNGSLRSALPVPAIDLIGCARSQSRVAELLARLRAVDGVQRVSLSSSEKSDSASLSDTDCRRTVRMPQFQVTVFFRAPAGIVPATDAKPAAGAAATGAAATSTTPPAGGSK